MRTKHLFRWSTGMAILLVLRAVTPTRAQWEETRERRAARVAW